MILLALIIVMFNNSVNKSIKKVEKRVKINKQIMQVVAAKLKKVFFFFFLCRSLFEVVCSEMFFSILSVSSIRKQSCKKQLVQTRLHAALSA